MALQSEPFDYFYSRWIPLNIVSLLTYKIDYNQSLELADNEITLYFSFYQITLIKLRK